MGNEIKMFPYSFASCKRQLTLLAALHTFNHSQNYFPKINLAYVTTKKTAFWKIDTTSKNSTYTPRFQKLLFWWRKLLKSTFKVSLKLISVNFKIHCVLGNFPQCKLCILGRHFKEKRSLHGTSRYGLVPGPGVLDAPPLPGAEQFNVDPVGYYLICGSDCMKPME